MSRTTAEKNGKIYSATHSSFSSSELSEVREVMNPCASAECVQTLIVRTYSEAQKGHSDSCRKVTDAVEI